jgi:D-3-phosphoglycerate dehydrogenase
VTPGVRLGSAIFNADHTRLGAALAQVEAAGLEFLHFDCFDGHAVPDLAFPPRTLAALRRLTALPIEVHLTANDPLRFVPQLADAGADLVFLPAETTPFLYEAIYALRERDLRAGVCLALGTPLEVLTPVLPLVDSVLLLGRVTGEGARGRAFNRLVLDRISAVRETLARLQAQGHDVAAVDLQAAGGLEADSSVEACRRGVTSLPLGSALHREPDLRAFVATLRARLAAAGRPDAPAAAGAASLAAAPVAPVAPVAPGVLQAPRFRILVASRSFGPNCPEAVERMRAAGCELVPNDLGRAPTEAELVARIGDADALISGTEPVTAAVLAAAPRLRVIAKHGVGYDNVDLAAAAARGVPVCVAGDAIADSVADHAFALLLALARSVPRGDRAVRAGGWPRLVGPELRGRTLGLVGLGQIGRGVCRRAAGFGLRLLAHDPFPDETFARTWGVRYVPLDELLGAADFVSLHAPLTDATRGLIDAGRLARMRPGAGLINTARGELVDESALYAALRSGHLGGAASDVFVREPPGASPLLTLDTFIATPHVAGQTVEGLRRMGEVTAENALLVLQGKPARFAVAPPL